MANRNTTSHFGAIPKIHQRRSRFDLSHGVTTTFNGGLCIPLEWIEVLPGDTFEIGMNMVLRSQTPLYPVMDTLIADVYFFYVPNRLLWSHWKAMFGENSDPWAQAIEYEIPEIGAPAEVGWAKNTVADYLGLPTNVAGYQTNALPFRAYQKIWNDWFRSEVVQYETQIDEGDDFVYGWNEIPEGYTYVNSQKHGITPLPVNKTYDYFTGALPSPQKGDPVSIPLSADVPVYSSNNFHTKSTSEPKSKGYFGSNVWDLRMVGDGATPKQTASLGVEQHIGDHGDILGITIDNLWADMKSAHATTVSELRTAFAIQKYYERQGVGGSRYIEYLRSIWGVESSDARLQRSEYLGGFRLPMNMSQIIQTSSTDATSPQGHASGFSCTVDSNRNICTKSFEEHGIIIPIITIRIANHTYQQGIERKWLRKKWSDIYNPYFAFLSEQSVTNAQIYAQGNNTDNETFGYQEAWAEYRMIPNTVTAEMRSNVSGGGFDSWHYADDYDSLPTLSDEWLREDGSLIDRTLAVSSEVANQFFGDFWFNIKATRCMPVYSVPGLIDHV